MVMKLIRTDNPNVNRYDTWLDQAWEEMNPLLQFMEGLGARGPGAYRAPVDFYEDNENYFARFELPGFKKSDLQVELENAVLTVSAKRAQEGGQENGDSHFSFNRSISVPDGVASDRVTARLEDGILTVTLPKEEGRKPRAIKVG